MATTGRSPSDPPMSIFSANQSNAGEKRGDNAILREKLPAVMRKTGNPRYDNDPHNESDALREALFKRLEMKNLFIAAVAEFIGTFLFLFFALAIATRAAQGEPGTITSQLYSSLGFGFSLW